jgi:hypothetical protein
MAVCSWLAQQPSFALPSTSSSTGRGFSSSRKTLNSNIVKRQQQGSSSLECLAIYQRKFEHIGRHTRNTTHGTEEMLDNVIATSHESVLNWSFLRFGVQWIRRYPYGPIAVSLSLYPVIENLWFDNYEFIATASVSEIQKAFSSGALHPFARDLYGHSLLLVSVYPESFVIVTD